MEENKLVFLCGARDFHAMDWYKSAMELNTDYDKIIVTDLIAGEGFKKIITEKDNVYKLLILDKFLFRNQSSIGDAWRNILKLIVLPLQVILLKNFNRKNKSCVYHAHSMYYLVLARAAGVEYIGTPQGSDILVKPYKSKFYNWFAKYGLKKAKYITVDSYNMKNGVRKLINRDALIIQNGIDLKTLNQSIENLPDINYYERQGILSIRGFTPLYRIKHIILGRNNSSKKEVLKFIYPFHDDIYKQECESLMKQDDIDLGRVDRTEMYKLFHDAKLVISIPESDSSPRSVYEAIFCGASVAITYNNYYELLPKCMKERIIIVDINSEGWFERAVKEAEKINKNKFIPDQISLDLFDQLKSFKKIESLIYN